MTISARVSSEMFAVASSRCLWQVPRCCMDSSENSSRIWRVQRIAGRVPPKLSHQVLVWLPRQPASTQSSRRDRSTSAAAVLSAGGWPSSRAVKMALHCSNLIFLELPTTPEAWRRADSSDTRASMLWRLFPACG